MNEQSIDQQVIDQKVIDEQTIETIDVSEKWKQRFKILNRLGADTQYYHQFTSSSEFKQLDWRSRLKATSNVWAFLGSFIYYFVKGMPYKACVILSLSFLLITALSLVEFYSGYILPNVTFWIIPSVLCSIYANGDYYRKKLHGENMWQSWPKMFHNLFGVIGVTVVSCGVLLGAVFYMGQFEYATQEAQSSWNAERIKCGEFWLYAMPEEIEMIGKQELCDQIYQLRAEEAQYGGY